MAQEPINRLPYANIVELEVDQLTAGSAAISSGTMVLSSLTVGSLAVTSTATIEALSVSSNLSVSGLSSLASVSITSGLTVGANAIISGIGSIQGNVILGSNSSDTVTIPGTVQGLTSSGVTTSSLTVSSAATIAGPLIANASAALNGDTVLGSNSSDVVTTNAGNVARPNMPAFFVYNTTTRTNVTGNGTAVTITFDGEAYDRGANVSTAGVLTAPYTGLYHLGAALTLTGITSNHTQSAINLVTSTSVYDCYGYVSNTTIGVQIIGFGIDVALSSGQTASVRLSVAGTSSGVDILGYASTGTMGSFFYGHHIG